MILRAARRCATIALEKVSPAFFNVPFRLSATRAGAARISPSCFARTWL